MAEFNTSSRLTMANIQEGIDARMFEQSPIHIIERYLESFSDSGNMTFPVAPHILEALAVRLRLFVELESSIKTLDDAFGAKTGNQRQARRASGLQYAIAFDVILAQRALKKLTPIQRNRRSPLEIAFINVASRYAVSVDTVRRHYKNGKLKKFRKAGSLFGKFVTRAG